MSLILTTVTAVEQVEKEAIASLVPKPAPKEPSSKRASSRSFRRTEQPLFDINPRTAREFLHRAKEEPLDRVTFQSQEEEFSQWKEEEEKEAAKVESPVAPPTSFAEALLRKMNLKGGSDNASAKGEMDVANSLCRHLTPPRRSQ